MYLLAGLGVVLAATLYNSFHTSSPAGTSGVLAENSSFQPIDVEEPRLHLDRLEKLRKMQTADTHRNIFVAAPLPAVVSAAQLAMKPPEPFVGPKPPPPPPPLQVPAEFFGYATRHNSGKKVAFFTSGDDVLVVPEGDAFLGRFRLVRINNDTAEIEELGTGRRTTVAMVQPPGEPAGAQ
jgi:hypothetical protein